MDKKYRSGSPDKKVVFINNCLPAIPTSIQQQCQAKNIRDPSGRYTRQIIASPPILKAYNNFMSGVDRHDRMVGQQPIQLTSKRGYKKLLFHVLAWFKEKVILSLCGNFTTVKKCRQYDLSYLEFGFIPSPNDNTKPMCLICGSLFSNEAMKPSRLKDYLTRLHPSELNADFKKIKADWEKQRNIKALFAKRDIRLENGLTASYNISLMIAKTGTPHTIGEKLILPCVKEVIETVICQSSTPVLSTVPLSNDTVQRHIDEMGDDVESQLFQILSRTDHALQIDESTVRDNEALLMGYVRFVHEKETKEEMLFVISLPSDTKAISLFEAVKDFYEVKGIPMQNIIQCATEFCRTFRRCYQFGDTEMDYTSVFVRSATGTYCTSGITD